MKKIVAVIVLILVVGGGVFAWQTLHSPAYALKGVVEDVQENGLEGLRAHLTQDGTQKLDVLIRIRDNEYIGSLLQMASQTEAVQNILTKFSELKWTLGDVQTGKESATVTANFKDPGSFSGSIDIAMKKEDNTWKIDSFDLADFSLQDASQSAQDKES